jgi:hypothetical protein
MPGVSHTIADGQLISVCEPFNATGSWRFVPGKCGRKFKTMGRRSEV